MFGKNQPPSLLKWTRVTGSAESTLSGGTADLGSVNTGNEFSVLTVPCVGAAYGEIHGRHQSVLQNEKENNCRVQANCYHKQIVMI